ncbi:hypothetical protein [Actinocorallia lasiicapitis]
MLVPASAAQAAVTFGSAKVVGKPILKAGKKAKITLRVALKGQNIKEVNASLDSAGEIGFETIDGLKLVQGTPQDGVWEGVAHIDRDMDAGKWYVSVDATDGEAGDDFYDFKMFKEVSTFTVYRDTKLTVAGKPAKPRKGTKFAVGGFAGSLSRFSFSGVNGWDPLKNQKVEIWWKTKGGKAKRLAVVKTDKKGKWLKYFPATKDGYVAAVVPITGWHAKKVTAWKFIDVK